MCRVLAIALFLVAPLFLVTVPAEAAIFTVNSTANDSDDNPGNGACETGDLIFTGSVFLSECTLLAAIEESNASPGFDEIRFSGFLPKIGGIVQFQPSSPYPRLIDPVLIDGYSHPDYDGSSTVGIPTPMINLLGNNAGATAVGIDIFGTASGSIIRGLAIAGFSTGIYLSSGQPLPLGNGQGPSEVIVQGNHIGILRGSLPTGNDNNGIQIHRSANNVIGQSCSAFSGCVGLGNVISANGTGIFLYDDVTDTRIAGNFIGTGRFGLSTSIPFSGPTSNSGTGIRFYYNATGTGIEVGSQGSVYDPGLQQFVPVAAGNVISGNGGSGLILNGDPEVDVQANMIGVNRAGLVTLPNDYGGIRIFGNMGGSNIGTPGIGGNVISGNARYGIECLNGPSGTIQFNKIGTNATGEVALPNADGGIRSECNTTIRNNIVSGNSGTGIETSALAVIESNWIGTNADGDDLPNNGDGIHSLGAGGRIGGPGTGNTVGHNAEYGIRMEGITIDIEGNYLGTDASGRDLGNTQGGIRIEGDAAGIQVGGIDGLINGRANTIAFNNSYGVYVVTPAGINNAIQIHGNYIGTDAAGRVLLGQDRGVSVYGADGIEVGAPLDANDAEVARYGNIIENQSFAGVVVTSPAQEVTIRGNVLIENGESTPRPIRLGTGGGGSDPGDFDTGANNKQNYPEIDATETFYDPTIASATIRYRVDSTLSNAAYPLRVDFYLGDPGGPPEARIFLGSDSYSASDAQAFRTAVITPLPGVIVPDAMGNVSYSLHATATDAEGSTSEFPFQPTPLPEPGTTALLFTGCAFLAGIGRRSRRR